MAWDSLINVAIPQIVAGIVVMLLTYILDRIAKLHSRMEHLAIKVDKLENSTNEIPKMKQTIDEIYIRVARLEERVNFIYRFVLNNGGDKHAR